ncbi:type I methionyl aminopeptidase [Patescibacteria group bacterium]|nr:MAG: type I methionyl aminopeptidase [Patescibacteria group bacterium]
MAIIKTSEEIEILRRGGALLAAALKEVAREVRPGVRTSELDAVAERAIRAGGGEPSFLGYKNRASDRPFTTTLCTSINHEVVHAPAKPGRELKDGDVVGLDIGARAEGYCTDMAVTVGVGQISKEAKRLVAVTRESLLRGLAAVKPGAWIADIGRAVQTYVEREGYSVVRDLVGHGIGTGVHEEPRIPNYVDQRQKPVRIEAGMALCLEPMVAVGHYAVGTLPDGWTIVTADRTLAAHFEVTIIVNKKGYEIITPLPV